MNGYKLALYALYALSALVTILNTGKPRGQLTPETVAGSLVLTAVMVTLVHLS